MRVGDFGGGAANQDIEVTNNRIEFAGVGIEVDAAAGSLAPGDNVVARGNYYGTATFAGVEAEVEGRIIFNTFRVDGSDAAPGTPGFQPAGAEVNTLVVTTLVDEDDAAATTENPGGAGLSLREAICFANADAAADTITFATGPGTIFLGTLNQLTISTSMSIIGPGITLSGRNDAADAGPSNNRLVFVNGGADPIAVTLDGLTLRDGAAGLGGAINATSVDALTVSNATLVGNFAGGGGGADLQLGQQHDRRQFNAIGQQGRRWRRHFRGLRHPDGHELDRVRQHSLERFGGGGISPRTPT